MPKRRYKPEEMVAKLRQVDVHLSQGSSDADDIGPEFIAEAAQRWIAALGAKTAWRLAVRGRMAMSSVSMRGYVTSCSRVRCSTRCGRHGL